MKIIIDRFFIAKKKKKITNKKSYFTNFWNGDLSLVVSYWVFGVLISMGRKYNYLTKSKITSGLQCKKKLWFDVHDPIKKDKGIFYGGNLFGDQVRKYYSSNNVKVLDLNGVWINPVQRTLDAIKSDRIDIIFEAAFEHLSTQVRTDVLIKQKNGWALLEAKSSTKLKPEHIPDIAIQSFIVKKNLEEIGKSLTTIKLIHVNTNFILKNIDNYDGLINDDNDLTEEINEKDISDYIKDLLPITNKEAPCPEIAVGNHCNKPYVCDYQERCKSSSIKSDIVPYTILPYIGPSKDLTEYMNSKETIDLQKVPSNFFKDRKDYAPGYHQIIQLAHKKNKPWFNPNIKEVFKKFTFPFYFMDFETAGQVVPIIKGTTPYYPLPFQWSVHKWESEDKELDKGKNFLKFNDQDIERQFIETLLEAVGSVGTIFAHSAKSVEIKTLERLREKESCKDLSSKIDNLISRVEDSAVIAKHNFYSPLMNGDWGIKSLIKAIPDCKISYENDGDIAGGADAGLAWFKCTDPKVLPEEKEKQRKLLLEYCAKDTLALYHLINHLMKAGVTLDKVKLSIS